MQHSRALGGGAPLIGDFKIGATLVAGQACIWLSGGAGSVTDPALVTDLTNAMGVVMAAAEGQTLTYSTTQGDTEGVAQVVYDPLAIFKSRVVPSATASTDYADGDGYFLTADSANTAGTTVADTAVGNGDAEDGMLFALSGNNAGLSRIITTATASTSVVVTVPFPNTIAAGDTFVYSQYAPGVIAVQMTTDFTQLDGTIAGATGGEGIVVDVWVETGRPASKTTPIMWCEFVMYDHAFNPVA